MDTISTARTISGRGCDLPRPPGGAQLPGGRPDRRGPLLRRLLRALHPQRRRAGRPQGLQGRTELRRRSAEGDVHARAPQGQEAQHR